MRTIRLAFFALFAVVAFSAMAASGVSAHPLFLTHNGKELLFLGTNPAGTTKPLLLATGLPLTLGSIQCGKLLVDGFALPNSTLAHRILMSFHGNCAQKINGGPNELCTEPVLTKLLLGELGLLNSMNKDVVILLLPSSGTTFVEFSCGGKTTTFEGALVGEIPETNGKGEGQLNTNRNEIEVKFESEGKRTQSQSIREIFLLGSPMTGIHLEALGVLTNEASLEVIINLHVGANGLIAICTH